MDADVEAAAIFSWSGTIERVAECEGLRGTNWTSEWKECPAGQQPNNNKPDETCFFTCQTLKCLDSPQRSNLSHESNDIYPLFFFASRPCLVLRPVFIVFYLLLYLLSSVLIKTCRFCTLFVDLFVLVFFFLPLLRICQSIWHFLIAEYLFYVELPL